MRDRVLIIGAGIASAKAALDLADSGITVRMVTGKTFLEDSRSRKGRPSSEAVIFLEVLKHPLIHLWTRAEIVSASGGEGSYLVSIRRNPGFVDLSKCTACGDCVEVCPVTIASTGLKAVEIPDGAVPGCAAIDKGGLAPCTAACPGGIPVQGYVSLISRGRFHEALALIEQAIPFPGICGRVCTHPCETHCRRTDIDSPVAIRLLKRFVSDLALEKTETQQINHIRPAGPLVAVIGSGPAGMTAAGRLSGVGYRISVFEKLPVAGGMMAVGIPDYRLPRGVIVREYGRIMKSGVEVVLGTAIGPDGKHSLEDLFHMGYRAVLLAIGAHRGLRVNIPGENLPGVIQGIELLRAVRLSGELKDGSADEILNYLKGLSGGARAAVLGGGNTAVDAARTLMRLGIADVNILYRRSRAEMPALPEEIHEAEKEGVKFQFLTAPLQVLGDEASGVTGLKCIRMRLESPDGTGRPRPVPIEGSDFFLNLDVVVPAIGQIPDIPCLGQIAGVDTSADGRIILPGGGTMTGRPGVFAAGDAAGGTTVIEAIASGKKAAAEIDRYLRQEAVGEIFSGVQPLPVVRRELSGTEKKRVDRIPVSTLAPADRIGNFDEVELGYTEKEAEAEAGRCLACGPCGECLACVAICEAGAIDHRQRESVVEIFVQKILYTDEARPFEESLISHLSGVTSLDPGMIDAGSEAAARILAGLPGREPGREIEVVFHLKPAARIGVFVCRCGDRIAGVVDAGALACGAGLLPGVVHAVDLPFSCTADGAEEILRAASENNLDRVVVAGCSCCALDQVCDGCTFQRIRCRQNLGVFNGRGRGRLSETLPPAAFIFVNIREHCTGPHWSDAGAASIKAEALIAGAVAEAGLPVSGRFRESETRGRIRTVSPEADSYLCRRCGSCVTACEIGAASMSGPPPGEVTIDPGACTGCGVCSSLCPSGALAAVDRGDERLEALLTGILR